MTPGYHRNDIEFAVGDLRFQYEDEPLVTVKVPGGVVSIRNVAAPLANSGIQVPRPARVIEW